MLTIKNHSNFHQLSALVCITLAVVLSGCTEDGADLNKTTFHEAGSSMLADWKYNKIPAQVKLNTVLELTFTNKEKTENPFDYNNIRLSAIFTDPSGKNYNVDGFYDGRLTPSNNFQWKLRFLPETIGAWQYKIYWSDQDAGLTGKLKVIPGVTGAIEHLVRPQQQHRSLNTVSGKPFYWIGGKWFSANNYGPLQKNDHPNKDFLTDTEINSYLDILQKFQHNGILLETSLFPLDDDGISWDLNWIHRAEWIIEQALQRNIYVQLNLFNTWSREKGSPFATNKNGGNQVMDVWNSWFGRPADNHKIENYIRTIVARFASYPNIFWELGNEMGHAPNCGQCFAKLAYDYYVPLLRHFDPYDLPISLSSKDVWQSSGVDIALGHQTNKSFLKLIPQHKPFILNELVRSDDSDVLWKDKAIRDERNRLAYRRTFWRVLMYGGSGASEATWLSIKTPLNNAVKDVMHDHMMLIDFLRYENLNPYHIKNTSTIAVKNVENIAISSSDHQFYIYLLENKTGESLPEKLDLLLPAGTFTIKWYITTQGVYQEADNINSKGGTYTITLPKMELNDIVLCIKKIK